MNNQVSSLCESQVRRVSAMAARWTAQSITLLIAAAASFLFILSLWQGETVGILQQGALGAACWTVSLTASKHEGIGGLLVMAGVSFALAETYASPGSHPFEGYETTLMSSVLALLMIPGVLFLVSHRLRCTPSFVRAEKRTGSDADVWRDWQSTARISSLVALLYTLRMMVLVGGNLEAYEGSLGMVLCGFLSVGLLGVFLSWHFTRSGGLLLVVATAGFPISLSVSNLQPWYGEPERTLGFIAFTMPLVLAALCQFTTAKPGSGGPS